LLRMQRYAEHKKSRPKAAFFFPALCVSCDEKHTRRRMKSA
jgi:hypothetical protein